MEDKRIADLALSASTIYNNNDRYSAQRSRLNLIGSAWSPQNGEKTQWLQVDFSRKVSIVQVATQGEDGDSYWVTSYSLSYNAEGQNFVKYENDHVCYLQYSYTALHQDGLVIVSCSKVVYFLHIPLPKIVI